MPDSFVDLTGSSPPPASNRVAVARPAFQKPADEAPQTRVDDVEAKLEKALSAMTAARLRILLTQLYKENDACKDFLPKKVLVPEKQVVPYHADSESEDKEESDEEEEEEVEELESGNESPDEEAPAKNSRKRAFSPETLRSRFAICENCFTEFDVTNNERGDCIWHPGTKEAYYDDDFWADHDEDCHGRIDDLVDMSDYEDGFQWTCCGGDEDKKDGCKQTKHKIKEGPVKRARY